MDGAVRDTNPGGPQTESPHPVVMKFGTGRPHFFFSTMTGVLPLILDRIANRFKVPKRPRPKVKEKNEKTVEYVHGQHKGISRLLLPKLMRVVPCINVPVYGPD